MAVPTEIREVPRPKNTIVEDSGAKSLRRYSVRERSSSKYIPGHNPQPHNGKVIGYIIDNKYVPRDEVPTEIETTMDTSKASTSNTDALKIKTSKIATPKIPKTEISKPETPKTETPKAETTKTEPPKTDDTPKSSSTKKYVVEPPMLSYGASALVKSVTEDIFDDLLTIYSPAEVFAIMTMATLKVIKPEITTKKMESEYHTTFVCKDYPGATLSPNSITKLLQKIGMYEDRRKQFYQRRKNATNADHHVIIDYTIKPNYRTRHDLFSYSLKPQDINKRDSLVIYAYDLELMEPIYDMGFYGKFDDHIPYDAFIRTNDVRDAFIISDKFSPNEYQTMLDQRPNLHFLIPIKNDDQRIFKNNMLDFGGVLDGVKEIITYTKKQISGGRYLYMFRNIKKSHDEESAYLKKNKNHFDAKDYEKQLKLFGTFAFESNADLDPKIVYLAHTNRWHLEMAFQAYNENEFLGKASGQGDFETIGAEFINFISTIATCRIIRKAEETKLLNKMTYGELIFDLFSAWRKTDAPSQPSSDDDGWVYLPSYVLDELQALGLSKPELQK